MEILRTFQEYGITSSKKIWPGECNKELVVLVQIAAWCITHVRYHRCMFDQLFREWRDWVKSQHRTYDPGVGSAPTKLVVKMLRPQNIDLHDCPQVKVIGDTVHFLPASKVLPNFAKYCTAWLPASLFPHGPKEMERVVRWYTTSYQNDSRFYLRVNFSLATDAEKAIKELANEIRQLRFCVEELPGFVPSPQRNLLLVCSHICFLFFIEIVI